MVLNRLSSVRVTPASSNVLVSVTNILGSPVKAEFNLEAESAKTAKDQSLFPGKKLIFQSRSSDRTTFDVKLLESNVQPAAGFYSLTVNLILKDKQYFLVQNKVDIKVATQASLVDVQLGVSDRDQTAPKLTRLEENNKLKERLEADAQTKLTLKFVVKEKSKGSLVEVHQSFLKFTEVKSGREVIFLAQAGLSKQYSAEVDFGTNAKNFQHVSGVYTVQLIVSDPLIENKVLWTLADLKLQFNEVEQPVNVDKSSLYSKRPEIQHMFRQPETTPSKVVSSVFTVLCVVPLGLLVVLWFGVGFNLKRFSFSLSGLVFHLTLLAIFGLFYCYWIKLNMFQTIRYLAVLGLVAFVSGNKLLKSLAANK